MRHKQRRLYFRSPESVISGSVLRASPLYSNALYVSMTPQPMESFGDVALLAVFRSASRTWMGVSSG